MKPSVTLHATKVIKIPVITGPKWLERHEKSQKAKTNRSPQIVIGISNRVYAAASFQLFIVRDNENQLENQT